MFGNMVFQTYLVAAGAASLREAIKLFWTFRVPWSWTYPAGRGLAAGAFKVCPQLAEQLTPSAEVVAKEFVPAKDG